MPLEGFHDNLETQQMLSVLSTSAGTCTERHRRVCSCVCRGVWDVMWSVWEWALAGPSLKSAYSISSLQEPALDPQPILQLPLAELAQQLRTEELSLESILCSYLEQVVARAHGPSQGLCVGVGDVTCHCFTQRSGGQV